MHCLKLYAGKFRFNLIAKTFLGFMKRNKFLTSLFLILTAALFLSCKEKWYTDFNKAQKQSDKKNKDLIVFFSSLELDGISAEFKKNVLDSKEFSKTFGKEFVFVNIDTNSSEEKSGLIEKYSVEYFPSVFFISREGFFLSKVEVVPEINSFESFYENCNAAKITELKNELKDIRSLKNVEKANAIEKFINSSEPLYFDTIEPLVKEFKTCDEKNETGLLGKYEMYEAYFESYRKISNGEDGTEPLIKTAQDETNHLTENEIQQLYSMAARLEIQKGNVTGEFDYEKIKSYLENAYSANPYSEESKKILDELGFVMWNAMLLENETANEQ